MAREQYSLKTSSTVNVPRLLFSISYANLSANLTWFQTYVGLKPESKQRTLVIANNTDVTTGQIEFFMRDSVVTNSVTPAIVITSSIVNGYQDICTSEKFLELSAHVDSITFGVAMGATAPTRGTLDFYVIELM